METAWFKEALFNGITANAFKLGTILTGGWFWVRVAGCSILYRGDSLNNIDFDNIPAVIDIDEETIDVPEYLPHEADTNYFYLVRRANICGDLEYTLTAAIKISIDSQGNLAAAVPNDIFLAKAEQTAGNKVILFWFYCPLEQKSPPAKFNVYYDNATGQIDYENAVSSVSYTGKTFYSYQTDSLDAGRYLFVIRTENQQETENDSFEHIAIDVTDSSPVQIDILSANSV